ncbi:hypothetical protein [Paraburkholderia diazotrophica]|uniref:hypothetical protein n=1 Tax=Paraburkholderia diazotrophica TaxID=667676 RepID=UPI0015A6DC4A|nr:hypothetical protein [Paraburkholderia diazotrophica]
MGIIGAIDVAPPQNIRWQARSRLLMSLELFRALDIGAEVAHYRRRIEAPINVGAED